MRVDAEDVPCLVQDFIYCCGIYNLHLFNGKWVELSRDNLTQQYTLCRNRWERLNYFEEYLPTILNLTSLPRPNIYHKGVPCPDLQLV